MTVLIEGLGVFYTALLNTSILTFFVGSIWMFESFLKDIASGLPFLNTGGGTSNKTQNASKHRFGTGVQLYSDVKQLRESRISGVDVVQSKFAIIEKVM